MKTPEERKALSEQKIQAKGIAINTWLPMVPPSSEVMLKDTETVCRRAIAALLSTQVALDISNQNYGHVKFFIDLMKKYGVMECLNTKERNLVNGTFSNQDAADVVWEYECYWSLVWALGLIADTDMEDAGKICDCQRAIRLVAECSGFEAFLSKCQMRDIEEILDMLDLYYRYHWATVEKKWVNPDLSIGNLNEEIVFERRRGLEWLISDQENWHDISLDT